MGSWHVRSLGLVALATFVSSLLGGCGQLARGPYLMSMQDGQVQVLLRTWDGRLPAGAVVEMLDSSGTVLASAQPEAQADGTFVSSLRLDNPAKAAAYRLAGLNKLLAGPFPVTLPRQEGPTRVLLYGDTRTNPDDHAAIAAAMARESGIQAVFHVGDFVADGTKGNLWDREFFDPARPLLSRCPIFPVVGNHEKRGKPFFAAFPLPSNGEPTAKQPATQPGAAVTTAGYYSRRIGKAHFVVVDLYQDWQPGSRQFAWLEKELASVPAGVYKIVLFHEPLFSANAKRAHSVKLIRDLGELFNRAGVDLVFEGHDHNYVRSLVIGEQAGKGGATYIITGAGGAPRYAPVPAEWIRYASETLEYVVLDIDANGRLSLSARDTGGREFDHYSMTAPASQVAEITMGALVAEQLVQTELEKTFENNFLIDKELKAGDVVDVQFALPVRNPTSQTLELDVKVQPGHWKVEIPRPHLTIPAGGSAEAVIKVSHDGKGELFPTPLVTTQWQLGGSKVQTTETALFLATAPKGALPRVDDRLVFDGMLTEKFWSSLPRLGYLLREDGKGLATGRTDMYVAAGPDAMYVAVVCQEEQMDKVRAKATSYDDPRLWSDDCVELFIEPAKGSKVYYQLVVSITGHRFDAKGQDSSWNGRWDAVVNKGQNSWTFEAKIPWSTLGMSGRPAPGTQLGFNVGRTRNAVKELSQWSRIPSGNSHTPEKFGTLEVK